MTPEEHLQIHAQRCLLMVQRHTRRHADRLFDHNRRSYTDDCVGRSEVRRLLGIADDQGGQEWLDDFGFAPLPVIHERLAVLDARLGAALEVHRQESDSVTLPLEILRENFALSEAALDLLVAASLPRLSLDMSRLLTFAWADFTAKQPSVAFLAEMICYDMRKLGAAIELMDDDANLVRYRLLTTQPHARWGGSTPRIHRLVEVPQRVLDFILGGRHQSAGLPGCVLRAADQSARHLVVDADLRQQLKEALAQKSPRLVLVGIDGSGRRTLIRAFCGAKKILDVDLASAVADTLASPAEALIDRLSEVLREGRLHSAPVVLRLDASMSDELMAALTRSLGALRMLLQNFPGGAIFCVSEMDALVRGWMPDAEIARVKLPDRESQHTLWRRALKPHLPRARKDKLAETISQTYRLTPGAIFKIVEQTTQRLERRTGSNKITPEALFVSIRQQFEHRLGTLAEPYVVNLALEDVVLSDDVRVKVGQILTYARNAERVFQHWGFDRHSPQGRGLSVLFSGPPGTGKTLLAGVLARALGRAVYRVDLSRIVDKYIGETEKNLAKVFDEAERAQAILLFDEADSLFAKRTAVKSSNDRYANLEVNFLLQRLEKFEGVSILTTNFVNSIDDAFQRRIRFKLEFPMPDAALRADLWRRLLPPEAPMADDIDFEVLGEEFTMSGGHIRNAVLRAAMEASGKDSALNHTLLWDAALEERRERGGLVSGQAWR